MRQPTEARRTRVVLLGFGAINRRVAGLLRSRHSRTDIVGVIVRRPELVDFDLVPAAAIIQDAADLAATAPDIVVEAATREAVRDWGAAALGSARRFIVSSASAFADDALLDELKKVAGRSGSQLVLSPGALAGVEALAAGSRLGMTEVSHRIIKSPQSWGAAAGEHANLPASAPPVVLFRGPARAAASKFPLNANVTAVSALTSVGLDRAIVELICDPAVTSNRQELQASGEFGSLTITIQNRPLQANPKSSEMAALSLVRLIENDAADFVL